MNCLRIVVRVVRFCGIDILSDAIRHVLRQKCRCGTLGGDSVVLNRG